MANIWKLDNTIYFCNKEVSNDGFTVKLVSAPGYCIRSMAATMGCIISKDGESESVDVDSNLLVELIKIKKLDKGVFEGTYSLASINGCKCFINNTMPQWKEAQEHMRVKGMKKTNKYVVGRNYKTVSIDELYLGEAYKVCEIKSHSKYDSSGKYVRTSTIVPLEKIEKVYMTVDVDKSNTYRKYIPLFRACKSVREYISVVKSLLIQGAYDFKNMIPKMKKTKPSRVEGDLRLLDDATEDDWQELFNLILELAEKDVISLGAVAYDNRFLCYNAKPKLVDYTKYSRLLEENKLIQDYTLE